MLAIVAPGQGAQTPGFLAPWLAESRFAEKLAALAEASELDLAHFGTGADADTIRDTAVAQPLLVAAGIVTALALDGTAAFTADTLVAGHSVGELTAAALSGVLSDTDAIVVVRERGRAMAEASAARPTSMTAIVGGEPEDVLAAIDRAGLTPANNNGRGQIVAAGTVEQLAALAEDAPRRARLVPLSVAGAFHTVHMQPAVAHLQQVVADVAVAEPVTRLVSNRDGALVASGRDALERIVAQVANPVRWDLCMETMAGHGVTGLLELAPSGTLTGIAKRNLKGVELFSLNTPDQIDDARAFVAAHAGDNPAQA
ncbi:ACP S-malonyltransferase [Tessaracoccus rhinocerotis]|uniref:[acyl-carrier-protein] S-malonyltransferase n=1 Tax=Tessaracoccus rhinocerotis TaxID=1689449 RepID=A0A553K440_9ACTN|nr:ACP S-malonyltransferase [Tessaracoccus rhinocerotis]TRY19465.1 ACP S-malonyltransferase [Tessaracoccus rhinocerotis]